MSKDGDIMNTVLSVKNLRVGLQNNGEEVFPVEDISFTIDAGESLALVGESGSGKSMTALSIMGLLKSWNSHLKPNMGGKITLSTKKGEEYSLIGMKDSEYDKIRGNDLSIIFQDPLYALNPVINIGKQITEVILAHEKISKDEARNRAIQLLNEVGIPEAETRIDNFPHQFSGGQLQRIMIAIAIACDSSCLIADEPTTALDVTIQKQILQLLKDTQKKKNIAILLITHDLGVVSQFADKVAVMFKGNILEFGDVKSIFTNPQHPYTKLLLESIPTIDTKAGLRLKTKKDFLSEKGRVAGEIIFDPKHKGTTDMVRVNDGHFVSAAFTREVS